MDRLETMRVFQVVADHGGFAAASRLLRMSPSTATRAVAALEEQVGARLLHRTTRAVRLTEAGREYLVACRRFLADIDEAGRAAAGETASPRGLLNITAPALFGRLHVAPLVLDFLDEHPEVRASIMLVDRVVNLIEEGIDLAVRIGHLPDSSLVATKVGEVRRVVCASPAYLAARGEPRSPQELREHEVIDMTGMAAFGGWSFGLNGRDVAVHVVPRLSVNHAELAIAAALAGKGLTRVLSYQIAEQVRAGQLRVVLTDAEPPASPVHLVYPETRPSGKVRAFVAFAARRLRVQAF